MSGLLPALPPGVLDPLVLLAGAAAGGGLFLLALAVYGLHPRPATPDGRAERMRLLRTLSTRSAIAAVTGVVVLVVTGWPVIAAGAVLLVLAWRGFTGGAAEERAAMRRLEGLAAWTESLRDTIAGAAGLEQAIPSSIRAAAPMLQPHLRPWSTGCTRGCRSPTRCGCSPTSWTTPRPTSSWRR